MKRTAAFLLAVACALGLSGSSRSGTEPYAVKTFAESPRELIEEYLAEQKVFTTGTYYGMSDGTWKTDEYAYPHMLEITGRLPGAQRDSTYVILSSRDDITFEEAWKASGLSSNTEDYFRREDAVFVGLG